MKASEIREVLDAHAAWLRNGSEKRADLGGANLREANLRRANLRRANLGGANLRRANLGGANLREADLNWADLGGANLRRANLRRANLRRANLGGANLREANLRRADLCGADLGRANLREADLRWANLCGANLGGTCLDPAGKSNGDVATFARDGGLVVGYRTANSPVVGGAGYESGKTYTAPVFSVADTECHPGLYLAPTIYSVERPGPYVKVWARPEDVHKAGTKWRAREFVRVESVE